MFKSVFSVLIRFALPVDLYTQLVSLLSPIIVYKTSQHADNAPPV